MTAEISLRVIPGMPEISGGTNLADEILARYRPNRHDILVVSQKLVSKAEGQVVELDEDLTFARLVRSEAVRIVRERGDLIICETKHGFICANSGIDTANIEPGHAVLLPNDPDYSAQRIRDRIRGMTNTSVGVIVTGTFERPWRRGVTDVAIGCAGIRPLLDRHGTSDSDGQRRWSAEVCIVDELASAAELLKGNASGNGVVVVSGCDDDWFGSGSIRETVIQPPEDHLFR